MFHGSVGIFLDKSGCQGPYDSTTLMVGKENRKDQKGN